MKTSKKITVMAMAMIAVATIKPIAFANNVNEDKVVVTIKGNVKEVSYNGQMQSVVGHSVEISNPNYTTEDFVCYAIDSVSADVAGTYTMGISSADFCNVNPNFSDVIFVVVDGYLSIKDEQSPNGALAKE